MGLLDDLLGGLAGQQMGGRSQPSQVPASGGGGGMSSTLMALMPILLAMVSNRGSAGASPSQVNYAPGGGGGGLGGLLGQILGGGAGGGMGGGGGLGSLLEQLQRAGFSEQANSWVGRGANQPIPPDAMSQIFGRGGIEEISRRAGISPAEASRGLSQLLPEVVDRITPDGDVPDDTALTNSVDDLARRLGIR
jgi:uncharacterized protein YidB (DUF937 family)